MPLTQHLWAWDGFVHGGQDFELGLFMIVVCVCLVLLRAQHGRMRISGLLAIGRRLMESWHLRRQSGWMQLFGFDPATPEPPGFRSLPSATPLLI